MKIWITRLTTGELHAGGLERCEVWFQKPTFYFALDESLYDALPFGNEMQGVGRWGWMTKGYDAGLPGQSVSFGKLFGYSDGHHQNNVEGLSGYVWSKLKEHYGNNEFPMGWYKYENEGHCKQEDFLLEINLEISSFKPVCP